MENLPGNWSPRPWRPSNKSENNSLSTITASASSPCVLASKYLSKQYNKICKTHKRLVKSGLVRCSVSLSDTPPDKLSLPSAPSSPPDSHPRQDSVHWGIVGEFSGVPTPEELSPSKVPKVPQPLGSSAQRVPVIRRPITPSSNLLQGVSALLEELQEANKSDSSIQIVSPVVRPKRISTDPNFLKGSETDPLILNQSKIDIVDTSISSFSEDSLGPSEVFSPIAAKTNTMFDLERFQTEAKRLVRLRRHIVREMEDFTEEDVVTSRVTVLERDLDRIKELRNQYQDGVEDFIDEYQEYLRADPNNSLDNWQRDVKVIGLEVKAHANKIRSKKESLVPTSIMSDSEKRSLDIQEKSLKLQELTLKEKQASNSAKVKEKEQEALVYSQTESNAFLGECSVLGQLVVDEVWTDVDDEVIGSAMRNLSKWQDQMNIVERSYRHFENMATKYNFPSDKRESIKATYLDRKERFEETKTAILKEDTDRCLYTLEPVKTDIIKYPTFSGLPSEDFLKFKETMEIRFKENKVKKREQVAKLRECLKGAALGRVPDGTKDIEEAFTRLNEAFGNPSKLMSHQIKALEDLGMMPSEKLSTGQLSYTKKIEWLLRLEVILDKILDLSKRSTKLAHEAFSSNTYRKLWARFPTQVLDKLVKIEGEDGTRLEAILDKIRQMRKHAQTMDDECGITVSAKKSIPQKSTADIFFKTPQIFENCRVCVHLSATGSNHQHLFEGHTSNYPTGCPKFVEATMDKRRSLIEKIKICPQCFHPDVIYNKEHLKDCSFSKSKKNAYSCAVPSCKTHSWICLIHKQDNSKKLDKFRADLRRKGMVLGHTTVENIDGFQTNLQAFNTASRKLRRTEKKKGAEIVPVPDGEPLFLFHGAQGRNRPINVFYDNGCSHAVFKSGIPGTELKGQLVARGPFQIGGVGGLTTVAEEEWVVLLARTDNKKQLVQGLTVPQVTTDFPMIDLSSAVNALKSDDPTNQTLQRCRVPPQAGGTVDVLLGSKYLSIFPEPIHNLPNGLTIYRSRLASHQGQYDCCIGGPHSSFKVLASIAGGTAKLLANFTDGLQVYRQCGPPKISSLPLLEKEDPWREPMFANSCLSDYEKDPHYSQFEVDQSHNAEHSPPTCSHCVLGCVAGDERIKEFRRHQDIHDSGLDVDYRCPRCRECTDCKNADKTEQISLREEAERYEIQKSVFLDFENKQILCTLPLIGKESDYLTCNRDRALKILMQQCKRYYKDNETKQTIIEAFAKLFNNGHAALLTDLTPEEKKFLDKETQYHIPWRVVFSSSPTTPTRPVLDASSRTSFRKDGTGGKSLNDLLAKGKVESINLIKVLLRFVTGAYAIAGDLKQFYNAFKLDKDQWNLQRILWIEDLNPNGKVLEAVIKTLIYGVKSVSAQTEFALEKLSEMVQDSNPDLARFLALSRYVDDLQDSKDTVEKCQSLSKEADHLFAELGVECKAWTVSGSPPSEVISKDGLSISVGGFGWFPEGDILELRIPKLHFGKSRRGRLATSVDVFEGDDRDMDKFVPDPLTRRQAASKYASVFDILGKLAPIMNNVKLDLRETFKQTESWDDPMPTDLRQKWVENFLLFEKLRGLKFQRAVMPLDAINTKMRLLTGVDAAKHGLMMGCWGGFQLKDGSWSNKLLLGRSLLAKSESIPKDELEALCAGSNMAWIARLTLKEWVDSSVLFGDSMIALCWLTSEKLKLSLFHRNRVMQIRRGTDLETVYHVQTESNPADCGTRPHKVKLSDVGPNSRWENGDSWMYLDIDEVVASGILKPATAIRVSKDIEDDFNQGLLFGERDGVLAGGFHSNNSVEVSKLRLEKLQERANYSKYIILPTKYSFPKLVRIYSYVMRFVRKASKGKVMDGSLLRKADIQLSSFICNVALCSKDLLVELTDTGHFIFNSSPLQHLIDSDIEDTDIQTALLYLFRKSSAEAHKFNKASLLQKISFEKDGVLFSKGRILDGMNFVETGEFSNLNIGSLGINVNTPVLDRYSPLSYCVAQYVHNTLGKHRGIETSNRISLEHVSIIQGMTLYREISDDCWTCKKKRKRFLDVSMGPIAQEQLMLAPPFHATMLDLFGPVQSYVPGFERNTRNRRVLETQMYVMTSVCITTKLVNLQILEGKKAHNIIDGFTRLCAEVGVPAVVHVDQDSGAMAGFREAELEFQDLKLQVHRQFGIKFTTCPVSGHHQHGLVERVIRSIQETFEDYGLKSKRLHSMGWQTFCKLAENSYNNLPFGYSHGRDQDNTELLRILTPNMLRVGRCNNRALNGPIKLPVNRQELLGHVEKLYAGWFKVFKDTVVPRLIPQPKWFKLEKDLNEGDIVYFKKDDSVLGSSWTVGKVDQRVVGRDGHIRRVIIKYHKVNENDPSHASLQFTDRSVRSLVKLWSVDEVDLFDDLAELQKIVNHDNIASHVRVSYSDMSWLRSVSVPAFEMKDGEAASLSEFTAACQLVTKFSSAVPDENLQFGEDELDDSSFERLIMSTGYILD